MNGRHDNGAFAHGRSYAFYGARADIANGVCEDADIPKAVAPSFVSALNPFGVPNHIVPSFASAMEETVFDPLPKERAWPLQ
jgi:hypothetical protein